jgi:hypothetical protein
MDKKTSISLIEKLAREWRLDSRVFLEINDLLFSAYSENLRDIKLRNEFSFIFGEDSMIEKKIRIANLLYFSASKGKNNRRVQNARMNSILSILEGIKKQYSFPFDLEAIRELLYFIREVPKWLFQFGLEVDQKGNLRIKLYFENERPDNDFLLVIKILRQICGKLGIKYDNSISFIIFKNKIGIIGLDLTKQGYSLKIYDYFHSPARKELINMLDKYELFFEGDKDAIYCDFKKTLINGKLFIPRDLDILFTYRFLPGSTQMGSLKIDAYLSSLPKAEKVFSGSEVAEKNPEIFNFLKNNNIKISFLGHEFEKMFFYVR